MTTQILTRDQIAKSAPAVYAGSAAPSVSERYRFVDTGMIIDRMMAEGFMPIRARQNFKRVESVESRAFGRHEIVFRHADQLDRPMAVGQSIPEIRLINSHDRSATYELTAGLFRLVCSNGLTISDPRSQMYMKGRHTGEDAIGNIIEGTYQIVKEFPQIADQIDQWSSLKLDAGQMHDFGRAAALLRWDDPSESLIEGLLVPRRREDGSEDLWTIMNRIQENVIRGGVEYQTMAGRNAKTMPVANLVTDAEFNGRLWELTGRSVELLT